MRDLVGNVLPIMKHDLHPDNLLNIKDYVKSWNDICNGRGHLCELCNIEEILYPFDDGVHVCKVCGAVFHRACATMKHFKCSRCERRNRRKQKQEKPKEYICDGKCTDDCDCTLKLVNHPYTE